MEKQYSGMRILNQIFITMVIVSMACLLICGTYSVYATGRELLYCNEAALDVYFNSMTHTMQDIEDFSNDIYSQDSDFRTLALGGKLAAPERFLQAESNILRMIRSRTTAYSGILVFDTAEEKNYYSLGTGFLGGRLDQSAIRAIHQVREYWTNQENPQVLGWTVLDLENGTILMRSARFRNLYICGMVDVAAYAAVNTSAGRSPIAYSFLTAERILTNEEYSAEHGISQADMMEAADRRLHLKGVSFILQTRFDAESGLGLCGMISTRSMWGNFWVYLGILILALMVDSMVFFVMYRSMRKMLIYPLNQITQATRQIAEGAQKVAFLPERIQEFTDIQNALGSLVEQKVTLETEKTAQASMKEHALLQYYQLQTRSHFLLNCLKSLYNLTARGEQEKTMQIITLFSNHLRYVFHDSLTFVSVQAELDEVRDYFHIIEQERADHILLSENVDPTLLDYPVPPLIIQTFVENFQKHNAQSDRILRFAIRIDRVELEEQHYVRIRLSDNGVGYSEDALRTIRNREAVFERYHVGIQNLFRRMDVLYGDGYQTAFFNAPGGGACSVFYLPEQPPEQETVKT